MDGNDADFSGIERLRRRIGRAAFVAVVAGLLAGLASYFGGQPWSTDILTWTVGVLLVLPIINVLAVLVEEVRQRDWAFASLAVAVLGLLAYAAAFRVVSALQTKGL